MVYMLFNVLYSVNTTCYITICKREKKKIIFDKIPLYLSGFDQGTFHCVHCALPTRPMAPGHDSSVGGIYIDVSWSFLGKSMLSAAIYVKTSQYPTDRIYVI